MTLGPLQPLADWPQFIVVKLVPRENGKTDKIPLHFNTGAAANALEPANWTDYATARAVAAALGPCHGVGFVLTKAAGFWCIDIDDCATPDGWSPLAHELYAQLPGTVIEASQSGRGLHLWGRGPIPEHACKNVPLRLECYSDLRFFLLGSDARGEMAPSCPGVAAVVARYFPPRTEVAAVALPADGPCAEWSGPEDDDELIERAKAFRSAAGVFGGKVTFSDLWEGNEAALSTAYPDPQGARTYDASSADMSLATRLAFLTGKDAERIERLMRRSALMRSKWDDRSDYLPRTIANACAVQRDVYNDGRRPTPAADASPGGPLQPSDDPYFHLWKDDPLHNARAFLAKRFTRDGAQPLRYWQGGFYEWSGAAWQDMPDADLRAGVYGFLEAGKQEWRASKTHVDGLIDALKAPTNPSNRHAPPCWVDGAEGPAPAELVATSNGLLHLPTRAFLAPSAQLFNLNAVPFPYDPAAPAPLAWHAFLSTLWPRDLDAIATLQEIFGYLLTADTSQQKIFLIKGPKRSGKGTIARVLSELVGRSNVASPSLSSLHETFGLEPLVGKLVALISDARIGARTDQQAVVENLLRISGEDAVTVNRKHRSAMTLSLACRFLLLTNELPRIADASGALASRFVVLTMSESFYGREDRNLTRKLLAELPGIFNWALQGWARLNQRGHFAPPVSSQDAAEELADLGSPLAAFVRERCIVDAAAEVASDALYLAYRHWAGGQGIERVASKPLFGKDLHALLQSKIKTTKGPADASGHRAAVYRGIGLLAGLSGLSGQFITATSPQVK